MKILNAAIMRDVDEQPRQVLSLRSPFRKSRPTARHCKGADETAPPYELLDRPLEIDDWRPIHGPAPTD